MLFRSTEAAVGVPIFTDSPSHGGSGGGTSPQLLPSVTPMPGIEAALQNAGMWASRDGFENSFYKAMINRVTGPEASVAPEDAVSMLRELDTLAQRWTIDATVRGSDGRLARSPVLLTLSLNEVVQEAWDQSVRSMLANVPQGNAIADKHDQVRARMNALIDRIAANHYGTSYLSVPDLLAEYRRAAASENTAASGQASAEYVALMESAGTALDRALGAAYDAADQASSARSQAQRVLLGAVSNQFASQAASIALSCQTSANEVLQNAASILEHYRDAKGVMRGAGLLPADLNLGRPSR